MECHSRTLSTKKLINLTKAYLEGCTNAIRLEGRHSTFFRISSSINQETLLFRNPSSRILLAFADDIHIVGNIILNVKEEFFILEKTAKEFGLRINEDKTKYMVAAKAARTDRRNSVSQNVTMNYYNFERIHESPLITILHKRSTKECKGAIDAITIFEKE